VGKKPRKIFPGPKNAPGSNHWNGGHPIGLTRLVIAKNPMKQGFFRGLTAPVTASHQGGAQLASQEAAHGRTELGAARAPEPGYGSKRSHDGEAPRTCSESRPGGPRRTSGAGARAAPSGAPRGIMVQVDNLHRRGEPRARRAGTNVRRRGMGSPKRRPTMSTIGCSSPLQCGFTSSTPGAFP
jgi:hypothetical protein